VDTIPVGGTVTWTWTGSLPHSVQSLGSTSFTSSSVRTASGTYAVVFDTPGTYQYDCAVHGTAMKGTIVVQ
jgi:plastocyanin